MATLVETPAANLVPGDVFETGWGRSHRVLTVVEVETVTRQNGYVTRMGARVPNLEPRVQIRTANDLTGPPLLFDPDQRVHVRR